MPRPVGVIQKPGLFEDILTRFGVNRPREPFVLDGDVVPVIIVDSGVSFVAAATPAYNVANWFTAGVVTAPAAGAVLADTGPLPVGAYGVQMFYYLETGGMILDLEWRNALNTANLRVQRFRFVEAVAATSNNFQLSTRLFIENPNERFRVTAVIAGGVGEDSQAALLVKL